MQIFLARNHHPQRRANPSQKVILIFQAFFCYFQFGSRYLLNQILLSIVFEFLNPIWLFIIFYTHHSWAIFPIFHHCHIFALIFQLHLLAQLIMQVLTLMVQQLELIQLVEHRDLVRLQHWCLLLQVQHWQLLQFQQGPYLRRYPFILWAS